MLEASNLIDFMDYAENSDGLCAMMDDRSNPETYQVSRVAAPWLKKALQSGDAVHHIGISCFVHPCWVSKEEKGSVATVAVELSAQFSQ